MAVHGGVLENLQDLFPWEILWHAVAISVELDGSTSSLSALVFQTAAAKLCRAGCP